MYGKVVEVYLPYSGIKIQVFVFCTPDTSDKELKERALNQLIDECRTTLIELH